MRRMGQRTKADEGGARGYSLPELLIVIALIGLFVVFGGPAVNEAFKSYKVRSAANDLCASIRALRYNAVSTRSARTMTIKNQNDATAPNQYTFTNYKGDPITVRVESGVSIETTSAASIAFTINGSTGSGSSQSVSLSIPINSARNDRYTITVTPTGTVSTAYTTF